MGTKQKVIRMICFPLLFVVFAVLVTVLMPDSFANSYQRVLVAQYDYLNSIEENKIVFIGNSSLAFGYDQELMEKLTGKPCPILGNNAGHGLTFLMEMSKTNLRPGDNVVIEFAANEYNRCGTEYLVTGIGNRYEMYKIFFPQLKKEFFDGYVSAVKKRFENCFIGGFRTNEPAYAREAFSDKGGMIFQRDACLLPTTYTEETAQKYGVKRYGDIILDPKFVAYVNDYTAYCESIGVNVYLTITCYMEDAVASTEMEMDAEDALLAENFNAPLISKSKDYVFEHKYFYNGIAHCNSEGAILRTELLYRDLHKYLQ